VNRSDPQLSIIVTSFNAIHTIRTCLDSLRRQATDQPFEIVLVDSSTDGTADLVHDQYPEVRLLTSPHRLHCGDARNRALEVTRADLIAFLDADCSVDENWVETVLAAHQSDHLLAGGIIDNAQRRHLVAWAYHFCEFSLWLPARFPREIREVAGCCLSLKRSAYDRYGPFIEGTYSSDTAFQWKTWRDGHQVLFTPQIRVYHQSPIGLRRFISHTFDHRRAYARVRSRERNLNAIRRTLEVVILPITPFLLMGATLLRLRRCPRYLPHYLACAPLLFLGYCARSCGELTGYLRPGTPARFDGDA
jgi:GT2 family glycosyltransferase